MASQSNDFATKKPGDEEKPQFIEDTNESPTGASLDLEKTRTLEDVDINNRNAFKGDDSDGKVIWNTRSIFAAIFLAGLYTGKKPSQSLALH